MIAQYTMLYPKVSGGARTANGIALCHYAKLYRYFVSQSNEFCRHITLCVASQRVFIVISLSTQSGNFWLHSRSD
jgi:hypothetical protein